MILGTVAEFYYLTAECLRQLPVFTLGVDDQNICVLISEKYIDDLTLDGKGFTRTGAGKHKSRRIYKSFHTVKQNNVV